MHSLPLFLRLAGRPVILVGTGEAADAKRRLLERAGAVIVGEEAQAAIAIIADSDEAAVARLRARGVLVNAVDRPDLCDFTLPAIVDRDPVLIAVGTGGASAGLAKMVRQRLETLLPARLGELATALAAGRGAMKIRWPDPANRRRALDAALGAGGAIDPFEADGADKVRDWLAGATDPGATRLVRLNLHSTDPDDLTLRAARMLGEADRLYHDPVIPAAILDRARADAVRIPEPPPSEPGEGLSLWLTLAP